MIDQDVALIQKFASLDKQSFIAAAVGWLGRAVSRQMMSRPELSFQELALTIDSLKARAQQGSLPNLESDEGRVLKSGLEVLTGRILSTHFENASLSERALSDIDLVRLCLEEGSQPLYEAVSELPPQVIAMVKDIDKKIVKDWWKKGEISVDATGKMLQFSKNFTQTLNDRMLAKILHYSVDIYPSVKQLVFFDFTEFPLLSNKAPAIVFKHCPALARCCFAYLKNSPDLLDHTLLVGGDEKEIEVNKELLTHVSPFFKAMWESKMIKGITSSTTTLKEHNPQTVARYWDYLIGHYYIEKEEDLERLLELFELSMLFRTCDAADNIAKRYIDIVWGQIDWENPHEDLAHLNGAFRPHIHDLPKCRKRFDELGDAYHCNQVSKEQTIKGQVRVFTEVMKYFQQSNWLREKGERGRILASGPCIASIIEDFTKDRQVEEPLVLEFVRLLPEVVEKQAYLHSAKILCSHKEFTKGKEYLELALKEDPNNFEAVSCLAQLLIRAPKGIVADQKLAKELLDKAAGEMPTHTSVILTLAVGLNWPNHQDLLAFLRTFVDHPEKVTGDLDVYFYYSFLLSLTDDAARTRILMPLLGELSGFIGQLSHIASRILLEHEPDSDSIKTFKKLLLQHGVGYFDEIFVRQIIKKLPEEAAFEITHDLPEHMRNAINQ